MPHTPARQTRALNTKQGLYISKCKVHCDAMQRYFNQLRGLNNDLRRRLYNVEREIDAILSGDPDLSGSAQSNLGNAQRSLRRRPRRGKDAFLDLIDFIAQAMQAIAKSLKENQRLEELYFQMNQDVQNARVNRSGIEKNIEAAIDARKSLGCIGLCSDHGQ